jgi:hypothetical protein
MMAIRGMQSIIIMNSMESLRSSGLTEIATWERSSIIATMDMANFIGVILERHTLGSSKMVREMAMVFIHGLMDKLITDSIKMIKEKDMDCSSG